MSTRLGWILEGIRTGIATTRYPARPDPSATQGLRVRPRVIPERCQADTCDRCVQACPTQALEITSVAGREIFSLDLGRCIGCGLCVDACLRDALVMTGEIELATRSRQDLRQLTVITPASSDLP